MLAKIWWCAFFVFGPVSPPAGAVAVKRFIHFWIFNIICDQHNWQPEYLAVCSGQPFHLLPQKQRSHESSSSKKGTVMPGSKAGLWIRIHFLRSWIQTFFAMWIRIRIQLNKICNKLPYEEFSRVEKDKKSVLKSKTPWSWSKFTYNYDQFPCFFCYFFPNFFSSWIQEGK